jgi:hypothetical protein
LGSFRLGRRTLDLAGFQLSPCMPAAVEVLC